MIYRCKRIPRIAKSLMVGGLVTLLGCDGGATPVSSSSPPSETRTAQASAAIELLPISANGLENAIAEQKGKVLLIDFWYLGCAPCRKKFPHLVEIHRQYADEGLAVLTYSIDPEDANNAKKVEAFLEKVQAHGISHYVAAKQTDADAIMAKFGVEYTPTVVLIGRDGQRIDVPEEANDEEIELHVRKALTSN